MTSSSSLPLWRKELEKELNQQEEFCVYGFVRSEHRQYTLYSIFPEYLTKMIRVYFVKWDCNQFYLEVYLKQQKEQLINALPEEQKFIRLSENNLLATWNTTQFKIVKGTFKLWLKSILNNNNTNFQCQWIVQIKCNNKKKKVARNKDLTFGIGSQGIKDGKYHKNSNGLYVCITSNGGHLKCSEGELKKASFGNNFEVGNRIKVVINSQRKSIKFWKATESSNFENYIVLAGFRGHLFNDLKTSPDLTLSLLLGAGNKGVQYEVIDFKFELFK